MTRLVVASIIACLLAVAGATWTTAPQAEPGRSCIPREQCCRICDRGKACGNSCISRNYTCHKGRGCACDSAEVCR
jgi:hypothetical protein